MPETAEAGEQLTPEQAAATIEQARGFEEPLRRRTEGVTWMIWGVVPAGIQLSYDAASDYLAYPFPGWLDPLILLGWPLLGIAMTYAVWRIAVLDKPGLSRHRWRSLLFAVLWLPVVYAAMGLAFWLLGIGWHGAILPLIGIGTAWLVFGATNAFKATPTGRRALLAIGAVILAVAAGIGFSVDITSELGEDLTQLAAIFVAGGVPMLAGLWQSIRG